MQFHEKLAALCLSKGFTSRKLLEDALGVKRSTLGRWFTGEGFPDIRDGIRLAKFLGVSLDFLADDELDRMPELLTEAELDVLKAAKRVGYDLALDRIMQAPESKAPAGLSWGEIRTRGDGR